MPSRRVQYIYKKRSTQNGPSIAVLTQAKPRINLSLFLLGEMYNMPRLTIYFLKASQTKCCSLDSLSHMFIKIDITQ